MAIFRALVVLGVCLIGYSLAQDCTQAEKDFGDCLKASFKQSTHAPGQGKPNMADMKQKADKCFTDSGCDVPQMPSRGPGGFTHPPGGFSHPPGGRAGRVDDGQRRQCFGAVGNKTKDAMLQCMRKTDPSFNFPAGGHGGAGEHGHGGPGGEHGGFGGHGGPHGGPQGGPGGHGDEFLTKLCKNAANVQKAKDCLKAAFPQQKPAAGGFCDAKKACEAKLGSCKDTLEKRRQAMCNCGNEVKFDEIMKAEPTCASLLQQSANKGPAAQHKPRDCTPKADPCAGH